MSTPATKHPVGVSPSLPSRPAPSMRPAAAPQVAPGKTPAPAPCPGLPGLAAGDVIDLTTGEMSDLGVEALPVDGATPAPIILEAASPPPPIVKPVAVEATPVLVPAPVADRTPVPVTTPTQVSLPTVPQTSTSVDTDEVWGDDPTRTPDPINYIDDDGSNVDQPGRPGPKYRTSRSQRAVKLTDRDIEILRFLCRYRFATYAQLVACFDTSFNMMRRRMPKLQREGLVKSMTFGATTFLLWRVTDAGADMSGLNLSAPRKIAATTIRHDLGLVDLGIRFEAAGEMVVTEREIRAADTRDAVSDRMQVARTQGQRTLTTEPVYAVAFGAGNGKQRGHMHIPDMVLVRPPKNGAPQSIAIELETQHKSPTRIREVLYAYKRASERNVGMVVFYTDRKAVRNSVNQAAIDTGTTTIVEIRKWAPAVESGSLFTGE